MQTAAEAATKTRDGLEQMQAGDCKPRARGKPGLQWNGARALGGGPNRQRDGECQREKKKKQWLDKNTGKRSDSETGDEQIILGGKRQRSPFTCDALGALKQSQSPSPVINPFPQAKYRGGTRTIELAGPAEVTGDVVFLRPLAFEQGFRNSVVKLLLPVRLQ